MMSPYSIEFPKCPKLQGRWLMIAPVISTGHASRTDYALLESLAPDLSACIAEMHPDLGGHLLCIDEIEPQEMAEELPGFSPEFHRLILTFQKLGYAYLRFDSAGETIPGLPAFDW